LLCPGTTNQPLNSSGRYSDLNCSLERQLRSGRPSLQTCNATHSNSAGAERPYCNLKLVTFRPLRNDSTNPVSSIACERTV
jgi:hypothetical protein